MQAKTYLRDTLLIFMATLAVLWVTTPFYPLMEPDEARYAEIPREMLLNQQYLIPTLNGITYLEKPPLFYWLQASAFKLFGMNEFTARLWHTIMAALTLVSTYVLARNLYSRREGLIAAGLLGSSVYFFALAHFVQLDLALTAFITLSLTGVCIGLRTPVGRARRAWFYLGYAASALAVLTKGLVGLLLPGMVVFLWLAFSREWRALKTAYLPTGLLIWLMIAMPWHVLMQQAIPEFFDFYIIEQHVSRYVTDSAQREEPVWFFIPILLVGVMPWGFYVITACRKLFFNSPRLPRPFGPRNDEIWLVIWALSIFAFFTFSNSKLIPYILPVFPPLFVLAAPHVKSIQSTVAAGLCSVVALSLAIPVWVSSTDRSIKPLAYAISQVPHQELVAFNRYYQDLPVYTKELVTVVNRRNELDFGEKLNPTGRLINEPVFWAKWHDDNYPMLVVLSKNDEAYFRQQSQRDIVVVNQTERHLLVSNNLRAR